MADEITIRSVKKCVTEETVFEIKIDGETMVGDSKEITKEISNWMHHRQNLLHSR